MEYYKLASLFGFGGLITLFAIQVMNHIPNFQGSDMTLNFFSSDLIWVPIIFFFLSAACLVAGYNESHR